MQNLNYKAVIFDLDGTLVNSEELSYQIYHDYFLKTFGLEYTPKDHGHTIGLNDDNFISAASKQLGAKIDKQQFYSGIAGKTPYHKCNLQLGALELLDFLNYKNIKMALATNTSVSKMYLKTSHLDIQKYFEIVITGEKVKHKKPNPEIYLFTSKKLGVNPNECVVIEDSESGIISASAAGCTCFYVPHKYTTDPKGVAERNGVKIFSDLIEVKNYMSKVAFGTHKC